LLIQHLKYSAMLSKIHSYQAVFFGDFAHWDIPPLCSLNCTNASRALPYLIPNVILELVMEFSQLKITPS